MTNSDQAAVVVCSSAAAEARDEVGTKLLDMRAPRDVGWVEQLANDLGDRVETLWW
jgi:hypothetical protein